MSNSFRPLELCRKLSHTLALNKQKCKAKHTWFAQNYPFATCASPACMKSLSGCHAVVNEIKRPTLSIQTSEVNGPFLGEEEKKSAFLLAKSTFSSERSDGDEKLESDEQGEPGWTTWTWCTSDLSNLPQLITFRPCGTWNPKAPLWARPSLSWRQTKPQHVTTISHEMDLDPDRWSRATANRNSTWIKQIKCCLFYIYICTDEPRVEGYIPLDTVQLGKELDTSSTTTTTYIQHPPLKFSKLSCTPLLAAELLQAQDQVLAMRSKWGILQMQVVNTHFAILNPVSHPPGRPIASTNENRSPPWSLHSTQNCQEDFNIRIPNMRLEMDHAGIFLQCSLNNIYMDHKSPSLCKSHDKGNVILVTEDTRKINAVLEADRIQPPCTAKAN